MTLLYQRGDTKVSCGRLFSVAGWKHNKYAATFDKGQRVVNVEIITIINLDGDNMPLKKINLRTTLVLLALIFVAAAVVLYQSINTPSQTQQITRYSKQLAVGSKMDVNISNLTASSQMYIIYGDPQYLKTFRLYSAKTVEDGLELYNLTGGNNKDKVEEILALSRTYITFVENEMLPIIQSSNPDPNDIKYLQIRNNEFSQQLKQISTEINKANAAELNNYYQITVSATNKKIGLAVIVILISLLLLLGGLYSTTSTLALEHHYLRRLADKTDRAILVVDRSGNFKEMNNAASSLLGISPEQLLDSSISDAPYFYPHLQNLVQPLYAVLMDKKPLANQKLAHFYAGKKVTLNVDYIPVITAQDRLTGVIIMANIVRKERDSVLLDTLEVERKRISIEIHDWIARYLSTLIHSIDYLLRRPTMHPDELKGNLLTMRDYCQNGAIEMRGIMNNIHPYLIDKVGLVSALESYVNIYESLNNIKVYVFYQKRSLSIDNKKEIIIYRIIQEALSNIVKHSRATEVDIHLTVENQSLRIEIEDNGGVGGEFTPGKGMWGMQERAKLVGGDISFEYSDTGFCVTLTVPLQAEEQEGLNGEKENPSNAD